MHASYDERSHGHDLDAAQRQGCRDSQRILNFRDSVGVLHQFTDLGFARLRRHLIVSHSPSSPTVPG